MGGLLRADAHRPRAAFHPVGYSSGHQAAGLWWHRLKSAKSPRWKRTIPSEICGAAYHLGVDFQTVTSRTPKNTTFCQTVIAAVGLLSGLAVAPARADSDVLLQAVSFAVTGSDANRVVVVDRAKCIFRVRSNTYYFNNVYTDRITFRDLQNKLGRVWTEVELHGKEKVSDIANTTVQEPVQLTKELNDYYREVYEANSTSYADYTLRIETHESARLRKAWQYVFANGCRGITSPF
jgi:hypothetical protein